MAGLKTEFQTLIDAGQPTGEVIGVLRFMVKVDGLDVAPAGSVILFENGEHGWVRAVKNGIAIVLTLTGEGVPVGILAVIKNTELVIPTGKKLLGRTLNPLMHPLDHKGAVLSETVRPVFTDAPGFADRAILDTQLETGVGIVDTLFPIVLGQRIAVMGDAKSGKSTFLAQLTINQAKLGRMVVVVMIAKRHTDVEQLINRLNEAKVREQVIIIVADIFDSMALQYIAPYAGAAVAEEIWIGGDDVVVIYDDFSSHAKAYREISLLAGTSPGRESFPGDMFYAHSSLLERAGKLKSNGKTLTALPVGVTPNDDIAGYLSTSLISMTDGQIVFDLATMHKGIRPAVNVGLSVSRVGGRAQTPDHKALASEVRKLLARSRQAEQFSHFGSDISAQMKADLYISALLRTLFNQEVNELFTLYEQQVMIHAIFLAKDHPDFSVTWIKTVITDIVKAGQKQFDAKKLAEQLLASNPTVKS
ncbi:MAG: sodium-transporting two-sector ATPase [bacterium]